MDSNETYRKLMEARIPFIIHYPSKGSTVFTVTDSIDNSQVKVLVECGASMTKGGRFDILFPEGPQEEVGDV